MGFIVWKTAQRRSCLGSTALYSLVAGKYVGARSAKKSEVRSCRVGGTDIKIIAASLQHQRMEVQQVLMPP